ncbi:DUF2127 domain-containing protein [Lysinibacter cavernae]|uniref:Uncharacterized membrane protein (DUF2068 family) n=1 Tax=Lysinibacter cavernae TaxID=1640652 RepID=A0A7X5TVB5_9MICO|nr:DUF2127 domain-containing protein [Lysinibacter cavernae]NIH54712.1 uncharacterized membrane protein (DUF2068 family) [Lysinibacter cavernae]
MSDSSRAQIPSRRNVRWAAILQLIQGGLMEGLPFLGLLALLLFGVDASIPAKGFSFIVPFFNEHLYLMMAMSGVFGALRVIGAIGLLRNRMWGFALSLINCVVTLVLMMFMLPAGIFDGLLSGGALLLLLTAWFGRREIGPAGLR